MLVIQSHQTLCDTMNFSRQEYWSGIDPILQAIFPTQEMNPGLPHCRWILYEREAWQFRSLKRFSH